jgi:hypothetical protein
MLFLPAKVIIIENNSQPANKWPLSNLALQGLKEKNYWWQIEQMRQEVAEYDRQQREPPPTLEQLAQWEREFYREMGESRFY